MYIATMGRIITSLHFLPTSFPGADLFVPSKQSQCKIQDPVQSPFGMKFDTFISQLEEPPVVSIHTVHRHFRMCSRQGSLPQSSSKNHHHRLVRPQQTVHQEQAAALPINNITESFAGIAGLLSFSRLSFRPQLSSPYIPYTYSTVLVVKQT